MKIRIISLIAAIGVFFFLNSSLHGFVEFLSTSRFFDYVALVYSHLRVTPEGAVEFSKNDVVVLRIQPMLNNVFEFSTDILGERFTFYEYELRRTNSS